MKFCLLLVFLLMVLATDALLLVAERRAFLQLVSSSVLPAATPAISQTTIPETIRVPLRYIPSLSAYVLYYTVAGERFGAILDTGSPFLMVPDLCSAARWGCYRPEQSYPSGLPDTTERFDNAEGLVQWRNAPFAFVNATGSLMGPAFFTFGVASESLIGGPGGGVFFGLIRDTDKWIRPSFLGQTSVKAFQIDLASQDKSLTLTSGDATSLVDSNSFIPLVKDLNRRYGDPTLHYTAKAKSVSVNGRPLARDGRPVYVIFDTGVTGMVVSQELFDERDSSARKNRERSLWGEVQLGFQRGISLTARKPVTTPLGEQPWPSFHAHLIVAGLAFLDNHTITVDINKQKLWVDG